MRITLLRSSILICFLLFFNASWGQIISQYVDANPGTFPKGIEIWNNTGAILNFSTNNLVIEQGTNGTSPTSLEIVSTGTLAVDEVLIIGTSDMEVSAIANSVRFIIKNFTFNGNDALVVKYGGTIIDQFGTSGTDPGSAWSGNGVSTADQNIQLKDNIITGATTGFTDPSTRFETVNSNPGGINGLEGFGIAPVSTSDASLKASVVTLNDLIYQEGQGPSSSQSFSISGNNLDETDVIIYLPTSSNFEISQTENGTYSNQILLTAFDGSSSSVFVRLKQGLSIFSYSDVISINGGGSYATGVYLEGQVLGDAFVLYEFTSNSNTSSFIPSSSALSDFSISSGSINYGTTGAWSGSGTPYAQGNSGWGALSPDVAKNFFFTLKPDAGYRANLSNISFEWKVTGAGPSAITIEINGTEIATFDATESDPALFSESLIGYDNLAEVRVEIKGWDNGSRSTTGGGQFRIDDVKIDGEIINKPFDYTFDNGAWTPESPIGISTSDDDILVENGSITLNQELITNDFQVGSEAVVDVSNILKVTGNLVVNGDLTFKSDATGSAQLVHETISNIVGDITVERYIPAKRAFRLLSSPVGGQSFANSWQQNTHITGAGGANNGFDATTTNNPSLFVYDNQISDPSNGAGWEAITSTTNILEAGKPYRILVRGDRSVDLTDNEAESSTITLVSKGNMLSGELTTGNQLPALSQVSDKFSFVANPYQAVVDFAQLVTTELTNFLYIWDARIEGNNGKGGYVTVDPSGTAPDPSSSDASKFLIPGQAFFVKNNETLSGASSLTFSPNAIASSEPQPEILSKNNLAYLNIRLYRAQDFFNESMEADAAGLRFSDDFTTSPSDEDADKFVNSGENLVIYNEKILSIDKRKLPEDEEKIQLAIANYKQIEYTLAFYFDHMPEEKKLILIDKYHQDEIEVTNGMSYNYTVDSAIEGSVDQTRFQLMLSPVTLSQDDFSLTKSIKLHPNPVNDILNIDSETDNPIVNLELYSVIGQKINLDFIEVGKGIQINTRTLSTGVYLVKIETERGTTTKRFIKN